MVMSFPNNTVQTITRSGLSLTEVVGHENMKRKGTLMLFVAAVASFVIHIAVSVRWFLIDLTRGNRKGIPISTDEAVPFFLMLALLACAAWLSKTARDESRQKLTAITIMNVAAFCFTAVLIQAGVIRILK